MRKTAIISGGFMEEINTDALRRLGIRIFAILAANTNTIS